MQLAREYTWVVILRTLETSERVFRSRDVASGVGSGGRGGVRGGVKVVAGWGLGPKGGYGEVTQERYST